MDINDVMRELAEYKRLQEEINATVDGLQDQIKQYMTAQGVDTITGNEHRASYKTITSARIDTGAIKRELPDIAARYTKTTTTRRFTFA